MTAIVINTVSVREGGSLVVLRQLLSRLVELRPDWRWHVATNAEAHGAASVPGASFHVYPDRAISGMRVRWWYEHELPALLGRTGADLLFSQTNYLPSRRLRCPSLLLVQHAGHFSPVFSQLMDQNSGLAGRLSWRAKKRWVRASVQTAQKVTVQTHALARRIVETAGVPPERVVVIPHGTGLAAATACAPQKRPEPAEPVRIGCISKHGVQKNFRVILKAARLLRLGGLRPVVVLTLPHEAAETRELLAFADSLGVLDCVENHGDLEPARIDALYRTLHVFVFSSLCESFGFPLVEAMAYGLPTVVSAIDSNIDIAGPAGVPFDPDDDAGLSRCIGRLASDAAWYRDRAEASLARSASFSWDCAAADSLRVMEDMMRHPRPDS